MLLLFNSCSIDSVIENRESKLKKKPAMMAIAAVEMRNCKFGRCR